MNTHYLTLKPPVTASAGAYQCPIDLETCLFMDFGGNQNTQVKHVDKSLNPAGIQTQGLLVLIQQHCHQTTMSLSFLWAKTQNTGIERASRLSRHRKRFDL